MYTKKETKRHLLIKEGTKKLRSFKVEDEFCWSEGSFCEEYIISRFSTWDCSIMFFWLERLSNEKNAPFVDIFLSDITPRGVEGLNPRQWSHKYSVFNLILKIIGKWHQNYKRTYFCETKRRYNVYRWQKNFERSRLLTVHNQNVLSHEEIDTILLIKLQIKDLGLYHANCIRPTRSMIVTNED